MKNTTESVCTSGCCFIIIPFYFGRFYSMRNYGDQKIRKNLCQRGITLSFIFYRIHGSLWNKITRGLILFFQVFPRKKIGSSPIGVLGVWWWTQKLCRNEVQQRLTFHSNLFSKWRNFHLITNKHRKRLSGMVRVSDCSVLTWVQSLLSFGEKFVLLNSSY